METIAKQPVEQSIQKQSLQKDLEELSTKFEDLEQILESQKEEILQLLIKINSNYADLTSQIDSVESDISEASYSAEEANDRSIDNESKLEELCDDVEATRSNLDSLENEVADIILTGND